METLYFESSEISALDAEVIMDYEIAGPFYERYAAKGIDTYYFDFTFDITVSSGEYGITTRSSSDAWEIRFKSLTAYDSLGLSSVEYDVAYRNWSIQPYDSLIVASGTYRVYVYDFTPSPIIANEFFRTNVIIDASYIQTFDGSYSTSGTWQITSDVLDFPYVYKFAIPYSTRNFDSATNPYFEYASSFDLENIASLQLGFFKDRLAITQIGSWIDLSMDYGVYDLPLSEDNLNAFIEALGPTDITTEFYYFIKNNHAFGDGYTLAYYGATGNVGNQFSLNNPTPILSPTVVDTNSTTIALTGDKNRLIRYGSTAKATMNAEGVKGATIVSYCIANAGQKIYEAEGSFVKAESPAFIFTATDSRGYSTRQTLTVEMVDYIPLTCHISRSNPDGRDSIYLNVGGQYYNGAFNAAGTRKNSLTVYYRYQVSGSGSWTSWTSTGAELSISNGTYNARFHLEGLDYKQTYKFQARAIDKINTVISEEGSMATTPVFDWSRTDFNFNVPVSCVESLSIGDEFGITTPVGMDILTLNDANGDTNLGKGRYDAASGNTNIYGNNVIVNPKAGVAVNAPGAVNISSSTMTLTSTGQDIIANGSRLTIGNVSVEQIYNAMTSKYNLSLTGFSTMASTSSIESYSINAYLMGNTVTLHGEIVLKSMTYAAPFELTFNHGGKILDMGNSTSDIHLYYIQGSAYTEVPTKITGSATILKNTDSEKIIKFVIKPWESVTFSPSRTLKFDINVPVLIDLATY